jgi:hypothetical protein
MFQVHGIDAAGQVMVRRQLRRGELLKFFEKQPACLVGMEACGTSHYWAREIAALGHTVKMMPPAYVKPYVKRGKTDAADAEAICEAVTRPTMRFVPTKTIDQQAFLMLHKTRELLINYHVWTARRVQVGLQGIGDGSNAVMCPAFDAGAFPLAQMGSANDIQTRLRLGSATGINGLCRSSVRPIAISCLPLKPSALRAV